MALASGAKLGPYEIVAPLGAGGMGEVYRARDTRLDRTVAVKILPAHLSSNLEAKQRFEREARAISSLNHPNICTLHDVGHQDGTDFLVMEYLEGETLADRLAKGPLPPEQVLRYGIDICEGLEKAHKSGVVHRDLKPGNIMLTKGGAKLMDFGLAKAIPAQNAPASALTSGLTSALTSSLTMTMSGPSAGQPLTAQGMLVGTFQYMAPEQIEGHEADARSDIFALGAVLYEMASGKRAFTGKTQASVVAAILASEPQPISAVQPMSPPALDRVVRICLAKDPDERWQTAHDVRLQLEWIAEAGSQAGVPAPVAARRKSRERIWMLAAVTAGVLAIGLAIVSGWQFLHSRNVELLQRSLITPMPDTIMAATHVAVSPDGTKLVYQGKKAKGEQSLWIRPLDSLTAQELAGTTGAIYPFWSPDSRFVGFFADGKLKKIDAAGGAVMTLCDAHNGRGGSWSKTGVILFTPASSGGLFQVSEDGGTATEVWTTDKAGTDRYPWFLPDGKSFLFYYTEKSLNDRVSKQPNDKVSGIYTMRLGDKAPKLLVQGDTAAVYAEGGYILYIREDNLLAAKFDAASMKMTGAPVPVAEKVGSESGRQKGAFAISRNGVLVYSNDTAGDSSTLDWYDLTGKKLETLGPPAVYGYPRISPNGDWVAFKLPTAQASGNNIWVRDLKRGTQSRLSFGEDDNNVKAVWSPDGKRIAYSSNKGIVIKDSTGLGAEDLLAGTAALDYPEDWSPDGSELVFFRTSTPVYHPFVYSFKEQKVRELMPAKFITVNVRFSPDGKWIVFQAMDSGRSEIYVMPYPGLDGKYQISVKGGVQPLWRRDGKGIFFVDFDGAMTSVEIKSFQPFTAGNPVTMFTPHIARIQTSFTLYDVAADDKRFLIEGAVDNAKEVPLVLVNNWEAGLKNK